MDPSMVGNLELLDGHNAVKGSQGSQGSQGSPVVESFSARGCACTILKTG